MDFNNYYSVQAGPPPSAPPPTHMMNNQPDYSMMSGSMTPNSIMHSSPAPSTPQSMRHTPGPPPMQQHHPMDHHQQQPSPHPHYHQLPPHPPISHSASPHPSHTPQGQPPPRPATGPSPLHHQVPPHMNRHSPKIPPPGPMQPMHASGMPNRNPHHHHIASSGSQPSQPPPQGHGYPGNSLPQHGGHPYGQPPMNHQNSLGPPLMNSHGHPQPMSNEPVMGGGRPPAPPSGYMPEAQERSSILRNRVLPTEFRIIELNKRLQNRPRPRGPSNPLPSYESSEENIWWERFTCDFFDNEATLTVSLPGDVEPQEFTIGRPLISRFFRSYFDGGVTDLSFKLRSIREAQHHPNLTRMDCDQTDIITKNIFKHPANMYMYAAVVLAEGHLSLDFVNNSFDNLVIKSWRFLVNQCHEYIDRSMTNAGLHDAYLAQPVTRFGLTKSTYAYLKMCLVMHPMQELMSMSKFSNLEPRECLKNIVLTHYNITEERPAPQPKRRKRTRAELGATNKKSKAGANLMNNANVMDNSMGIIPENNPGMLPLYLDVLVLGEPSMLGTDFGDENERSITRIENEQPELPTDKADDRAPSTDQAYAQAPSTDEADAQAPSTDESDNRAISTDNAGARAPPTVEADAQTLSTDEADNLALPTDKADARVSSKDSTDPAALSLTPNIGSEEPVSDGGVLQVRSCNQLNCIPEDREDNSRSNDVGASRPPPSASMAVVPTNGCLVVTSTSRQNRRRSSERREMLREGLMRAQDFVIKLENLKDEHPVLWRITTANNLLQQFEPKSENGTVVYENTHQYHGWNPEIERTCVGVDVRLTQQTRNQVTVERLLLNFQKLDDPETFFNKHFLIYLQILISTALDPKFWEGIEADIKNRDYFVTSRKIIEDIIRRHKLKLASKLKLHEVAMKNFEKYPNLMIAQIDSDRQGQPCRACNTNPSTQIVKFDDRSYDLHSYKPVKVTSEPTPPDSKDHEVLLCDVCLNTVKLYSEVHHLGWRLFNVTLEKIEQLRGEGKPVRAIMDECLMKDEDWINKIYSERDSLWSRIDAILASSNTSSSIQAVIGDRRL